MSETCDTIDPSKRQEFKLLQVEGKNLAAEGRLKESLEKFERAKRICPTEKILRRIEKLKSCLQSFSDELEQKQENNSHSSGNEPSPKEYNLHEVTRLAIQKVKDRSTILHDIQNVEKSDISCLKVSKVTDLSPEEQCKFRELKRVAKELSYEGKYEEAIGCFRKALDIFDCPSIKRYINEVQLLLSNNVKEADQSENVSSVEKYNESHSVEVYPQKDDCSLLLSNNVKEADQSENVSSVEKYSKSHSVEVYPQKDDCSSKTSKGNEADTTMDIEEKLSEVKTLYCEARDMAAKGQLVEALEVLEKAQFIHETQKVQRQIDRLKELLAAEQSDSENDEMIRIASGFSVYREIYNSLYPYQREGLAWMWQLFQMRKGGVLGDDMGLGKTFQVIAFLSGMIDAELIKNALIIMPVSLIPNWQKEFKKWCPGITVRDFHGSSKKERERNLLKVQRKGDVLVTSYGMVVGNLDSLVTLDGNEFIWDYVILDEGHKIKNPTKTTKAVHDIPAKNRLVLTGTPVQNNLRELWSLFDFVHQGTLLGSLKTFKLQYENPITRAREKDATAGEKRLGMEMAENLKALIKLYFLRRTKDEIWGDKKENTDIDELETKMGKMAISKLNARKNDLILWTYMSDSQVEIYNSFLHSDAVKSILVSKRSPLVELTILKKICDHPRLLSKRACTELGLNGEILDEDTLREMNEESSAASSIDNVSDETLILESGKLKLVINLLEKLKETGHRTLVFSLSRKILDMIHRILVNRKWKVMRLDGSISKLEERQRRIQKFQTDPSYYVFLLTTQVGGVGLTLTAADRVIIYDPSWNPATDAQAVDRVYRIGQQNNVVVYRLITCGSVEEKIYRRQIFKDSITRQATGSSSDPYRYFSKQELRELFSLENPHHSATQVQLNEMHGDARQTYNELESHITFLKTLNIFGISDHDLMFSGNLQDHSEDNDESAVSHDFIKKQVAAAQQLITAEATVVAEGLRIAGTFNRPYQEIIKATKKGIKDLYKPPVLPEVIDITESAQDQFPIQSSVPTANSTVLTIEPSYSPVQKKVNEERAFSSKLPMKIKSTRRSDAKRESNERKSHSDITSKSLNDNVDSSLEKKEVTIILDDDDDQETHPLSTDMKMENSPVKENAVVSETDLKEVLGCDSHFEELDKSGSFNKIELHNSNEITILPEKINSSSDDEHISDVIKNLADDENLVTDLCQDQKNRKSGSFEEINLIPSPKQRISSDMKSIKLTSEFQEKFQNDLTHLMSEDLINDLSLSQVFDEPKNTRRKSCARKSAFVISDSDSSHQGSGPPSLNNSENLAEDSIDSSEGDSSNSASLSFVPDSVPTTPQLAKQKSMLIESFVTAPSCFNSPELVLPNSNTSLLRGQYVGNVERITPLKIDKNFTRENPSFAQALAASPIFSPHTSPEANINSSVLRPPSRCFVSSNEANGSPSDDESPIKVFRRKKHAALHSESEESDDEDKYSHQQLNSTRNEKVHEETGDKELDLELSRIDNYDADDKKSMSVYSNTEDEKSVLQHSNAEEEESMLQHSNADEEESMSQHSNAEEESVSEHSSTEEEESMSEHSSAEDSEEEIEDLSVSEESNYSVENRSRNSEYFSE